MVQFTIEKHECFSGVFILHIYILSIIYQNNFNSCLQTLQLNYNLVVSLPGKTCVTCQLLLNIQSRVKQEVDMPQIQNCVTRYSSPY